MAQKMSNAFKQADSDGNGTLDAGELCQLMKILDPTFSDSELDTMMKSLDLNGDGVISQEEFVQWISKDKTAIQRSIRNCRKPVAQKMQRSNGATRSGPRKIDWSHADPERWEFPETIYGGSYSYSNAPVIEEVKGTIADGMQKLKDDPAKMLGIFYQTNMTEWPEDQQVYKRVMRTRSGFHVNPDPGGGFTYVGAKYQALAVLEGGVEVDAYTDGLQLRGSTLESISPGRGAGCDDVPTISVLGDVDPNDVMQGGVGDCWLLSAISAFSEYKGAVAHLFRNTESKWKRPLDPSNSYTITLYDLTSWEPVDIVIDERLCCKEGSKDVLGCKPSYAGELWAPYLEKAVAIHCGGWDKICGGQCVHAWRMLTGCKHQFTFRNSGDGFGCFGTFNPNSQEWEELANSPHDGFNAMWPMEWPDVGGGGGISDTFSAEDLFERMCAWDDANYLMACGTKDGSDTNSTDGIVDGHAYSILACLDNAGGSDFDMIKVRNPWGKGEFTSGNWVDDGAGWDENPEVKAACKPKKADDGVFWVEKDEFFQYFETVYLCALDMSEFVVADPEEPPNTLQANNGGLLNIPDGILTKVDFKLKLADGRLLYVNPDGYGAADQDGDYTNSDDDRRVWNWSSGYITLADGRQLFVNPDGWAGVMLPDEGTNTEDDRRLWSAASGIMSLADGRQLYTNQDGWLACAMDGEYSNNDDARRTWEEA